MKISDDGLSGPAAKDTTFGHVYKDYEALYIRVTLLYYKILEDEQLVTEIGNDAILHIISRLMVMSKSSKETYDSNILDRHSHSHTWAARQFVHFFTIRESYILVGVDVR